MWFIKYDFAEILRKLSQKLTRYPNFLTFGESYFDLSIIGVSHYTLFASSKDADLSSPLHAFKTCFISSVA